MTSEVTTSEISARVTRVEVPIASPGACVLCGKSSHPDGFAATDNLDFEFYGTVYFCADCVGDYARVFGYMSPALVDHMKQDLLALRSEVATLRQAILLMEDTVDNLTSLRDLRDSFTSTDASVSSDDLGADESADRVDEDPVIAGAGDELPVSEPGEQPRRDDIHNASATVDELLGEL